MHRKIDGDGKAPDDPHILVLDHGLDTEVLHPHDPPRVILFCSGEWYEAE